MSVPAVSIGLPTTGALVTTAQVVAAAGAGPTAIGAYCKVTGDINPVDQNAPKIKFQINLPTQWNGKAIMYGGGGNNGTIPNVAGSYGSGAADLPVPLGRGYAVFASDFGHQGRNDGTIDPVRDASFAVNEEAFMNFTGQALKKTRDVAGAIIRARYGNPANKVYFIGTSTGGREALIAISNWPQDFDGAIAVYPAWDSVALNLAVGRLAQMFAKPGVYPNPLQREAIYKAAINACDALDGLVDGVISNQNACNASFDPMTATIDGSRPLRCSGGANSGENCLSDAQISAFKTLNAPMNLPYTLASGEAGYPGWNVWGSDYGTPSAPASIQRVLQLVGLGTVAPAYPLPPVTATSSPPSAATFWEQWVKYAVTRDSDFNWLTLDPTAPGAWQSRIIRLSGLQEATKTDLSAFRAKGGKLLIIHGTHDVLVSPRSTQRYMARLRASMRTEEVRSFARYYEIPGYNHAVGTAFHPSWNSLGALDDWVGKGVPPVDPIVTDTLGVPGRTRPLCEYPAWPRYNGSGDAKTATNFSCTTR